ncbi:hypothetical protein DPEC_G00319090 [Dallia pectoralis]|uniref:Uncharacterized protein n=1 Tax=Dallia pectoralis TaxID=75939 RepID=A0ACC2F9F6_DALPE|nr:hypothetical protein DPEC_G00319090 [Dallia pectoralis]
MAVCQAEKAPGRKLSQMGKAEPRTWLAGWWKSVFPWLDCLQGLSLPSPAQVGSCLDQVLHREPHPQGEADGICPPFPTDKTILFLQQPGQAHSLTSRPNQTAGESR